jgi:arylsulfatase A-like enzyme
MTGKYPHATGVTLLRTPLPDSVVTVAEILSEHNFATGVFGKTHFNSKLKQGFDTLVNNQHHRAYLETVEQPPLADSVAVRPQWKPFRDPSRVWLNAAGATSGNYFEHSQGTFFARATIDFIRNHKQDRFFAVAIFREPHSPFNFPVEFQGAYNHTEITLPQGSEEDDRWIPAEFKDLTKSEKEGITRSYYSSVEYMDQNIGLLLDALDQMDLTKNTLVIFIGDHGYLLNHHKRFEKHMMWEEAVTTPLIIRGFQKGSVVNTPVELVDLAPTILEALMIENSSNMQGNSLVPLLNGQSQSHRQYSFSEYLTDNKAMITDGTWKYIFTSGKRDLGSGYSTGLGASGIDHRLYNLEIDPGESRNLADSPDYEKELHRLQMAMLNKFRETHPYGFEVPTDISSEEQLSMFCEPPEGEDTDSM